MSLSFLDIQDAQSRIAEHVTKTPILTNQLLNQKLGAEIYFKCENFQTTGSFKALGAFNKILKYQEDYKKFPEKVVAVSSGNHAQAIAFVAKKFGIKALIYMDKMASQYKINATKSYGAEVIILETKKETEVCAEEKVKEGYLYVHSSNDPDIVCGQGTSCLSALEEIGNVDVIFTACGGGGLISGAYIASQILEIKPKVFAAEPFLGNDTAISFRTGKIYSFDQTPKSIADGARTLRVSAFNFPYIQKLDGIYEITEEEIIKWTQIISSYLKVFIEPTSALGIAACYNFLQQEKPIKKLKILVILSGGNVSQETAALVWAKDYLADFNAAINTSNQIPC